MQKPETVEWKKLRNLWESDRWGVALPTFVAVLLIVFFEKVFRKKSLLEGKLGISLNLSELDFYDQSMEDIDLEDIKRRVNEYVNYKGNFSGKYTIDDLPQEMVTSFDELTAEIDQMTKQGKYWQAINRAFSWLSALSETEAGQVSISKYHQDGSSSSVVTWHLFDSEVTRLIGNIHERIPTSNIQIAEPAYFYLQAAFFRMEAVITNPFSSVSKDDDERKIIELLEKAKIQIDDFIEV